MKKECFSGYPPFINRKKEQKFLYEFFSNRPKNNLFLYGPKSTGKTTLIKKVLKELDPEIYAVSYFNMRETSVLNMRDFRQIFFPEKLKNLGRSLLTGVNFNFGFFSWKIEEESMLQSRIFGLMMDKIVVANKEGIKPVIVLDEFQYLRDIFVDDKKEVRLIEELFKFFIALTKQNNLAHVVCLTSDSYYMEELYNDTKLSNTSRFELVDHLSKSDVYCWLGEKEGCPNDMVKDVWENLGGSVWEIWQVFVNYKNRGDWKYDLNDLIQMKYSYFVDHFINGRMNNWKDDFWKITEKLVKNGEYTLGLSEEDQVVPLMKFLVSHDLWFYDPKKATIYPNSQSVKIAMKKILEKNKTS